MALERPFGNSLPFQISCIQEKNQTIKLQQHITCCYLFSVKPLLFWYWTCERAFSCFYWKTKGQKVLSSPGKPKIGQWSWTQKM